MNYNVVISTRVEGTRRYSNPPHRAADLRKLVSSTPVRRTRKREDRTPKQPQRQLSSDEVAQLCTLYGAGEKVADLAPSLGICLDTLFQQLRRQGVHVGFQPKLGSQDFELAARIYGDGESLASIAERLHVSPETVRQTLLKANIAIRPRRCYA
jgi:transposase-like protein